MPKSRKKVIIVGAGPGGLTAGILLAHRGCEVAIYEKEPVVGGRNRAITAQGFTFDSGPTFLMMKFILDEIFEETGRSSDRYLTFSQIEPMYRLIFPDKTFEPTTDHQAMTSQIEKYFPGQGKGVEKFMRREKHRFDLMYPCLQHDYSSLGRYFTPHLLRALPALDLHRSLFSVLGDYFTPEQLRLVFTFQSKYLGMSAWECPAAFGILPYIEHGFGIWHTQGGLSAISDAMAKVVREAGGSIHTSTAVKQLLIDHHRRVTGVVLANGETVSADSVILNADFAHAMSALVPAEHRRKYTDSNLRQRPYSCSTFMLYLGLDKVYPSMPHHAIYFAGDYRKNVNDIFRAKQLSNDISFYIRNASINDPTLAPKGKSSLYVLVPVPNLSGKVNWIQERQRFRDLVVQSIEQRTDMKDLSRHIEFEKVIDPLGWRDDYAVYHGATFNLAHNLTQMLYLRPRNRFEEFDHCYLVGGGTHPGSGLPTIYESGRISANLLCRDLGISFTSKNVYA